MKKLLSKTALVGLMLSAQFSMAGSVQEQPLPLEIGGIAGVAALTLIIATQLIKRRK